MKNFRKLALILVSSLAIGAAFPYVNYALDQTYSHLKLIVDVMELIRESYVDQMDSKKLVYGAAKGMVAELDDYSQFMEPDVYERVKSDTEGEFGGIGIRVDMRDGWLTVVTPLPGTPAFKAGLMPGDKITKIEGENTRDQVIDVLIKKLRGTPGTKVNITIAREPSDKNADWETKEVALVRELIKSENVRWKMLSGKTGYIRIIEFTGHSNENFLKGLGELKAKGMESLVLDLRYNPGGLLSSAVDISKLFMGGEKMIVSTRGRKAENQQEFRTGKAASFEDLPVVVLINRFSASASEILAGALQDNKRAVIIGERSFGKASVQSMIPLSDKSALRLTIAKYYTPSGKSIQRDTKEDKEDKGGILPDIEVKVPLETEKKLVAQGEELYYPGKEEKAEGKDGKPAKADKPEKPGKEEKKKEEVRDEMLERALELLKAREVLGNLKPAK
jgi:carboxyl-terminal processing protease